MTTPTPGSSSPPPSDWVAILDAAGSLAVVVGVMSALALLVTPEVWPTFTPIAIVGTVGGVVLVRWARSRGDRSLVAASAGEAMRASEAGSSVTPTSEDASGTMMP